MKYFFSDSNDPAYNLALEEILFREETAAFCLLYVNSPCVVIGSNQVYHKEVNETFCDKNGIPVFRRITGGGAVYHDEGNLNYSFITNRNTQSDLMTGNFLHPVMEVLKQLDVETYIGKRKDLWMPGDYKISGTASHMNSTRVIQHGTLLYDADLSKLQPALKSDKIHQIETKGIASVPSPVMNIRRYIAEHQTQTIEAKDFFIEFSKKLAEFLNCEPATDAQLQLHDRVVSLRNSKYTSDQWNKRK